jgi:hypothetical protein
MLLLQIRELCDHVIDVAHLSHGIFSGYKGFAAEHKYFLDSDQGALDVKDESVVGALIVLRLQCGEIVIAIPEDLVTALQLFLEFLVGGLGGILSAFP